MSKKDYQNSDDHSLTFSVAEAAKILGLSKGNLYNQIRLNAIPCVCIGRRKLIPKAALLQWLEKSGADSKTVETIRSLQQEHSPDGKVVEKENQNNDVAKDDMKRIADALEELTDIRKETDPGQGISPNVIG